jgi:hypothetical protein
VLESLPEQQTTSQKQTNKDSSMMSNDESSSSGSSASTSTEGATTEPAAAARFGMLFTSFLQAYFSVSALTNIACVFPAPTPIVIPNAAAHSCTRFSAFVQIARLDT